MRVQSLGQEDPLEEGMATYSSILACKIPWTEEPVGYRPCNHKESDMTEQSLPRARFGTAWSKMIFGFPGGSDGKESLGLIPGLGRSPGEGNSSSHRYSGLEKSMDRGAWQATVYGIAES